MSAAARYAQYVHRTRFEDLPTAVVEQAKTLLLDAVGCALGATQTAEGAAAIGLAERSHSEPEATVIGTATKARAADAAFVNAQLTNLLDFDDTYDMYRPGHPGCRIVPAALAVAESRRASGKELLTAMVLGYEISLRVGRALGSILWTSGLTTLAGPLGPTVAAAKLIGLDARRIEQAFGILNLETGLDPRPPVRQKMDITANTRLGNLKGNVGKDAELGIVTAVKAASGLAGVAGLLDVELTGWYLVGLPGEGYDALASDLGTAYRILDVSLKPTPSCRLAHPAVTAAWHALGGRTVAPADVVSIVIRGVVRLARYRCTDMIDAQLSTPYAVALAITSDSPGPAWYASRRFLDEDIRGLADQVRLEADSSAEALEIRSGRMTSEVEIVLRDGTRRTGRCDRVKGSPDNPLSRAEVVAKFHANAGHLQRGRREALLGTILSLESVQDLTSVTRELATHP